MTLLDLHFRNGIVRTLHGVDHCAINDVRLCGYDSEGRMILYVSLERLDHIEVRAEGEQVNDHNRTNGPSR